MFGLKPTEFPDKLLHLSDTLEILDTSVVAFQSFSDLTESAAHSGKVEVAKLREESVRLGGKGVFLFLGDRY